MDDFIKSKKLLSDFLGQNKVDTLKSFSFYEIESCDLYGCPNRIYDGDDTNLARAMYYLVCSDKIKDLELNQIGAGKKYRGDTLNTYNTVFGKSGQIKKYSSNEKFLQKVEKFRLKYQSIGNFILLPNIKGNKTINCYRGVESGWFDFFDRFLHELKFCYEENEGKDVNLYNLKELNSDYFKLNDSFNTFSKFVKNNYLDDYIDNAGNVLLRFAPIKYHWKYRNLTPKIKDEYIKYANIFIDLASSIIDNRADKIILKLNEVSKQ